MGIHKIAATIEQPAQFILRDLMLSRLDHLFDFFQVVRTFQGTARMNQLPLVRLPAAANLEQRPATTEDAVLGLITRRRLRLWLAFFWHGETWKNKWTILIV